MLRHLQTLPRYTNAERVLTVDWTIPTWTRGFCFHLACNWLRREFLKAFLCIWVIVTKRKHFLPVMVGRPRSRTWINSTQSSGTRKILQKLFSWRQTPIIYRDWVANFSARNFTHQIGNVLGINRQQTKRPSFRFNFIAHWRNRRSKEKRNWNPTIWNANWNWLCDNCRLSPMNSSSPELRNLVRHKADLIQLFLSFFSRLVEFFIRRGRLFVLPAARFSGAAKTTPQTAGLQDLAAEQKLRI